MNMPFPTITAPDRYDAALSALVPINEPENIRKLRKRLMTARDLATRVLSNPEGHTDQALLLHQVILVVASAFIGRLQDIGGMEDAANLCVSLLNNASTVDRLGGCHVQSN